MCNAGHMSRGYLTMTRTHAAVAILITSTLSIGLVFARQSGPIDAKPIVPTKDCEPPQDPAHLEECFYGLLNDGDDNCCKKKSTRGCYACCNDNCPNESAQCQELCDDRKKSAAFIDPALIDGQLGNAALRAIAGRLDDAQDWAFEDVVIVEWISVKNTNPGVRRLATVMLAEAWAKDLLDEESADLVQESFSLALISRDHHVRSAAMHILKEFDLTSRLDTEALLPEIAALLDDTDALRQQIDNAFPDASDEDNQRRLRDHIDLILDTIDRLGNHED